jgi:single-strand DNA-binding protein
MNHVSIIGRLTADAEMRSTQTGKAVCSFNVAVDNYGKDNGASFIPCVAWEKTAEFVSKYFKKGSQIGLEGRLQSRQYEDKDKKKRTVLELVVNQVHFCGSKAENSAPKNEYVETAMTEEELPF